MANGYREVIIHGDSKVLKGFVACYRSTHRIKSGLVLAREHPINRHHLKEILTFRHHHLHLIAGRGHYRGFMAALRPVADGLKLKVVSDRPIRRAWFEYEFETANRRVAATIKRMFANLPTDVRRVGRSHKEKIDPSAKGVEVYSPSHEYTYRGGGKITGNLESLLALHAKFEDHEFIDVGDISLKH
jgi:hypothetical protein